MANYKLLQAGDTGEDVKKLQQALLEKGYDLGVGRDDGIYGEKTAGAVRQYQKDNRLAIDGIAGNETLTALYAPTTEIPVTGTPRTDPKNTFLDDLTAHLSQKPTYTESPWEQQAKQLADQYMNREDFAYRVNEDALYRQLQDQYTAQGRLAMLDTMAQAQARNGGYGSSYAQSVGQQAYGSYMQDLTAQIPKLYELARENYDAQGQQLLEKLSLASRMSQEEYDHYEAALAQWLTERDYLQKRYEDDRSYAYQTAKDSYDHLLDLLALGYDPTDDELSAAGMTRAQANAVRTAATQKSSGGSGKGSGDANDLTTLDYTRWKSLFDKAKSQQEATTLRDNMRSMGMDEEIVSTLYDLTLHRLEELEKKKKQKADQLTPPSWQLKQDNKSNAYTQYQKNSVFRDINEYLRYNGLT